jgi:hypothetical protein
MLLFVLITSRPVAPAISYPLSSPIIMSVLGQLLGQLKDFLVELHIRGVDRLWIIYQSNSPCARM